MKRAVVRVGVVTATMAMVLLGIGVPAAFAQTVLGECTLVDNPTSTNHTECAGDYLGTPVGAFNLDYADLDSTTITNTHGSRLDQSTFVSASLKQADWSLVGVFGADFSGATLDGINLYDALENGAVFANAHIVGANLTWGLFGPGGGYSPASFAGANLTNTDFTGAQFGSGSSLTDFTGATLTGTIFTQTTLVPSSPAAVAATSPSGAPVTWPTPQSETGEQPGSCSDASGTVSSGSVFPVGTTTVTCRVDSTSNGTYGTGTFSVTVTGTAPTITSPATSIFTVGQKGTFTPVATGSPAPALTEKGTLPGGVTFAGGVLSGTPAVGTGGSYPITLTAANGVTPDATQDFTLTVNEAPAITSAASTTFTAGQKGTFTVAATGFPAPTFTEKGSLPKGVSLSTAGLLSGTPAAGTGGSYPITFTAANGVAPDATQQFTLTVNEAPAFTSRASSTFTVGTKGSFTVTATGFPPAGITEKGTLPDGVTFTTGTLSGTPAAGTGGSYPITFTAANGVAPDATQQFTLTVNEAPAITSAASTTFTAGQKGTFTATASGFPAPTFTEKGTLPKGVSLSTVGLLSGTPAVGTGGRYPLTLTATNSTAPASTQQFTLTVDEAPAFTSSDNATFTTGQSGSLTPTATGFPAPAITEKGTLPTGITFTNGTLSGTPAAGTGGSYPITLTAINGVTPDATENFTLTVDQAPAITSAASTTFTTGQSGSLTPTATGFPAPAITEKGTLPTGITFTNGTLSGTPGSGTGGTYPITLTAINGVTPDATQDFTLTVDQAPAITSATGTTFTVGQANSYTIATTGFPAPAITEKGALPKGVTFTNGTLSGIPSSGAGGSYPITFTATNGVTPDATQQFTLTVNEAPAFTSRASSTFTVGTKGSFTVTATGFPPAGITEKGILPDGVTFTNGTLSGTPAANTGGSYPITFTAANGVTPDATQQFTLTVDQAPAITSAASTTFTTGQNGSLTPTASGFPAPTFTEKGALPKGVRFVDGVLSGTPAAGTGGSYPITLTAANRVTPDATQQFTLTVDQAPAIIGPAGTTFTTGHASTVTITSSGFPAPTFTEKGALPKGMTFTDNHDGTATLSGTPTVTGKAAITITGTSAAGSVSRTFTFTVIAPLAITGTLPSGTVGAAYHAALHATGGMLPYTWSLSSGSLPPGLALSKNGTVSGTPTTKGTFTFAVAVNDPAIKTMTIVISAPPSTTSAPTSTSTETTTLAFTGAPIDREGVAGLVLLLLGGALIIGPRRRRRKGTHS